MQPGDRSGLAPGKRRSPVPGGEWPEAKVASAGSPLPVAGASTGRPPWVPPGWHLRSWNARPHLLRPLQPPRPPPATPSPALTGRARGAASAAALPGQDLQTSSLSGPATPGLPPTAPACALPEVRISGIRVSLATGTAASRHCTNLLVAIFSEGKPERERAVT